MTQSPKSGRGLWRYENGLVLMMFIVFGLVFFERLNILYLFPYMAPELGLNNTQIGLAVGILGIAFGVSSFVFSSISDFIGSFYRFEERYAGFFHPAVCSCDFSRRIGRIFIKLAARSRFHGFCGRPRCPADPFHRPHRIDT